MGQNCMCMCVRARVYVFTVCPLPFMFMCSLACEPVKDKGCYFVTSELATYSVFFDVSLLRWERETQMGTEGSDERDGADLGLILQDSESIWSLWLSVGLRKR